uniref:TolC family protein n=1 Tax=Brachyspira pilosicoli TaxID=52584 RepID=UPI0018DF7029
MKNSFDFILIIVFNISLYSQSNENSTNSKISINLEQALDLAIENDKTLKQAEYDVRIAQTQKDASFSDLFLPSLTVSGGLNLSEPKEY